MPEPTLILVIWLVGLVVNIFRFFIELQTNKEKAIKDGKTSITIFSIFFMLWIVYIHFV